MAISLLGVNGIVVLPFVTCLAPSGDGFSNSEIVFTMTVSACHFKNSPACLEWSGCAMAVSGALVDGGSGSTQVELACMHAYVP